MPRPSKKQSATPPKEYQVTLPNYAVNSFTGRQIPVIPENFKHPIVTRDEFLTQCHLAFELIGGVPRLALWADANDTNYEKFINVFSRLSGEAQVKTTAPTEVKISLADGFGLPRSDLDEIELRDEKVVNARYTDITDVQDVAGDDDE